MQRAHAGPAPPVGRRSSGPACASVPAGCASQRWPAEYWPWPIVAAQQDRRRADQQGLERHPVALHRPLAHAGKRHPLRFEAGRGDGPPAAAEPDRVAPAPPARCGSAPRSGAATPSPPRAGPGGRHPPDAFDDVGEALREGQVERSGCRAARRCAAGRARRRPSSPPDRAAAATTDSRLPSLRA